MSRLVLDRIDDRRGGDDLVDQRWGDSVLVELAGADAGVAEISVDLVITDRDDLAYDPVSRARTDERFRLHWRDGAGVMVEASGRRAARWALTELAARSGSPGPGTVETHGPAFVTRGILEGFYGPPWSQSQREDMIGFAARHRFNTFLYAPKDDPFLRRRWRQPHEAEAGERLQATIRSCRSHDITPMIGVSPGLSMRYSSAEDRELLGAKLDALVASGAGSLALLLDDIPGRLQHPEDLERYPDLVTAHIDLGNWVFDLLDRAQVPLVICPTQYWGEGDEAYISTLGRNLDPRVELFWTGRAICSPAITAVEAANFARSTNRPPLYWDNYPVNDVAMRHEMHLGPYRRRDPMLHRFSRGVMANAMQYAEASKVPLATVGDYLWEPSAYDPDASWERALAEAAGADVDHLRRFADTVRESCMAEPDPVELGEALERFAFELEFGDAVGARHDLAAAAAGLRAAVDRLMSAEVGNPALAAELRPWLVKGRQSAEALELVARHARGDGSLSAEGGAELQAALEGLESDPHRVCGDLVTMTLESILDGAETGTRRTT